MKTQDPKNTVDDEISYAMKRIARNQIASIENTEVATVE